MFAWLKEWLGICPNGGTLESGAFHDWEYLRRDTEANARYEVDVEMDGDRLPRLLSGDCRYNLYHRVCLSCEREDNTIEEFKLQYRQQQTEALHRQRIARAILNEKQRSTTPPEPQR